MKNRFFTFRFLIAAVLAAAMLLSLSACGAGRGSENLQNSYAAKGESLYDENVAESGGSLKENAYRKDADSDENHDETADVPDTLSEEKLVYTCGMTLETLKYQETMAGIRELIRSVNGFIASESETDNASGWYYNDYEKRTGTLTAYVVVRVPASKYDAFLAGLSGTGKVIEKHMDVKNITRQYSETATTVESLKIQEKRLLEMLEKADNIPDMLTIEARLSEVQTKLAVFENQLNAMDTDVAYSTVSLTVREVMEFSPDEAPRRQNTFFDRLSNALRDAGENFLNFFEGFLFGLIRILPILLVLGGIAAAVIIPAAKKRKAKKAEKARKSEAGQQLLAGEDTEK